MGEIEIEMEMEMEMEIEIVREWLEIESEIRVFLLVQLEEMK